MLAQHLDLFSKHVPNFKKDNGDQWRGNCPFHHEKTPKNKSFSVNVNTGQYFCHSCDAKGNDFDFAKKFGDIPNGYNNPTIKPWNKKEIENVDKYNRYLLDHKELYPNSWDEKIIELLKVGWNPQKENFTFPIFDKYGKIVNIKNHHRNQFQEAKATLYPSHFLHDYNDSDIVITEGEIDLMTLLSNGIQAVTSTGGARNLPLDISALSKFKRYFICSDNDRAGDICRDLWIKHIKTLDNKNYIRTCDLSEYVDVGGDVTNYFLMDDKSFISFNSEIIERSIWAKLPGSDVPDYFRNTMLSEKAEKLWMRDRIVLQELILRATRFRFTIIKYHGMDVRVKPGDFVMSYPDFAKLCGKGMSPKMVLRAAEKLEKLDFIKLEDLKMKRGMRFTLRNWIFENGHSESHSDSTKMGIQNITPFSLEDFQSKIINEHSE